MNREDYVRKIEEKLADSTTYIAQDKDLPTGKAVMTVLSKEAHKPQAYGFSLG